MAHIYEPLPSEQSAASLTPREILGPSGTLVQWKPGFEDHPSQFEMSEHVYQAILIEIVGDDEPPDDLISALVKSALVDFGTIAITVGDMATVAEVASMINRGGLRNA
jgi:hypothetical protein